MSDEIIVSKRKIIEKPEGISPMLFEYVILAHGLDKILNVLTRRICSVRGPYCDNDFGCCIRDAHLIGTTEEMELYQRLEGKTQDFNKLKCKYHDGRCTLRYFKPPLCLTYLCTNLEDEVIMKYKTEGYEFIFAMADASDSSVSMVNGDNGRTLFSNMEKAIHAGEKILNKNIWERK